MEKGIDWSACEVVERVPGKAGGQPVIKGTRVRPGDLLVNRNEGEAWLAENYGVSRDTISKVFSFTDRKVITAG